jgi:hypothetical protein
MNCLSKNGLFIKFFDESLNFIRILAGDVPGIKLIERTDSRKFK